MVGYVGITSDFLYKLFNKVNETFFKFFYSNCLRFEQIKFQRSEFVKLKAKLKFSTSDVDGILSYFQHLSILKKVGRWS